MSAVDTATTKECVRDPIGDFVTKIHYGFDVLEFVRTVWNYEPVDIPLKPMPTALHSQAEHYTLPYDAVASYLATSERESHPFLITIFEHLQNQLFGEPQFQPSAPSKLEALCQVSTRPSKVHEHDQDSPESDDAPNSLLRPLEDRTASGSSANEHLQYEPHKSRTLDTKFFIVEDEYVNGNYSVIKPDVTFSTTRSHENQHWSWIMALGEVKKGAYGKVWAHMGDVHIPLDRLNERPTLDEKGQSDRKRKHLSLQLPTSNTQPHATIHVDDNNDSKLEGKKVTDKMAQAQTQNIQADPEKPIGEEERKDEPGSPPIELDSVRDVDETLRRISLDDIGNFPSTNEVIRMAKYMNEMMSHGIRSYGSGFLIRDTTMWLWYADRMGATVSESFDIIEDSQLLLLVVAAMSTANVTKLGICSLIRPSMSSTFASYAGAQLVLAPRTARDEDGDCIAEELEFEIDVDTQQKVYTEFGAIGRGTTVIPISATAETATSLHLERNELVAKISWPVGTREAEHTFIRAIRRKLQEHKPNYLQHIVELRCSHDQKMQDLQLPRSSMDIRVHEPRVLRTLVLQRYERLEQVDSVDQFKGVFLDVVRAHHWVWETSEILHRDISVNNIMFYRKDGRTFGVLCDWDLAARRDLPNERADDEADEMIAVVHQFNPMVAKLKQYDAIALDTVQEESMAEKLEGGTEPVERETIPAKGKGRAESSNSQEQNSGETQGGAEDENGADSLPKERPRYRSGTGPFMALDLLSAGRTPHHRYRHDLESFFFVLAYFCAVFMPSEHKLGRIPQWEASSLLQIGDSKRRFVKNTGVFYAIYTGPGTVVHPDYLMLTSTWLKRLRMLLIKITVASENIAGKISELACSEQDEHEAIQNEIRELKARRNTILTYKSFMACLGEYVL